MEDLQWCAEPAPRLQGRASLFQEYLEPFIKIIISEKSAMCVEYYTMEIGKCFPQGLFPMALRVMWQGEVGEGKAIQIQLKSCFTSQHPISKCHREN